jgi:hypothetical protein
MPDLPDAQKCEKNEVPPNDKYFGTLTTADGAAATMAVSAFEQTEGFLLSRCLSLCADRRLAALTIHIRQFLNMPAQ